MSEHKRIGAASFGAGSGSSLGRALSSLLFALSFICCVEAAPAVRRVVVRDESGEVVVVGAGHFVTAALPAARARLARFALAPHEVVTIVVDRDVHDFVMATGQTTPSLRAWSTWKTIHLLPPDTWTDPSSAPSRIAHELCHLALWQRATEDVAARLPRFVSEGVCSVVADQGEQRMPRDDVRARVASDGDNLDFDDDAAFSYGYAHHVFATIYRCGGASAVVAVVDASLAGARVEHALPASPRSLLDDVCW